MVPPDGELMIASLFDGVGGLARAVELNSVEFSAYLSWEVDPELEAMDVALILWIPLHTVLDPTADLTPLKAARGQWHRVSVAARIPMIHPNPFACLQVRYLKEGGRVQLLGRRRRSTQWQAHLIEAAMGMHANGWHSFAGRRSKLMPKKKGVARVL